MLSLKFHELQKTLTSFSLYYFHCLATGELNTKQSGGAQISTATWLWKIPMWALYYHPILAAGKLGSIDLTNT